MTVQPGMRSVDRYLEIEVPKAPEIAGMEVCKASVRSSGNGGGDKRVIGTSIAIRQEGWIVEKDC